MTKIYETDKLNAGSPQLVLENKHISVLLQPEIGGRILDVETKDFLFYIEPIQNPCNSVPTPNMVESRSISVVR